MHLLQTFMVGLVLSMGTYFNKESFHQEVKTLLEQTSTNSLSLKEIKELAHEFEQVGNHHDQEWLAHYYTSYYLILEAFMMTETNTLDDVLDRAEYFMMKSDSLNPENSEVSCLKSMIASARIMKNPAARGQKYGQLAAKYTRQAIIQNPLNPRPYYLEAQGVLYMPKEYGGGCEAALPIIKKSATLFENFSPISSIHPNWGQEENLNLLNGCTP